MPHPGHYPWERDSIGTVWESGWATGVVWTGTTNLAPTGIWFPDYPACNEVLYWLPCPPPPPQ